MLGFRICCLLYEHIDAPSLWLVPGGGSDCRPWSSERQKVSYAFPAADSSELSVFRLGVEGPQRSRLNIEALSRLIFREPRTDLNGLSPRPALMAGAFV